MAYAALDVLVMIQKKRPSDRKTKPRQEISMLGDIHIRLLVVVVHRHILEQREFPGRWSSQLHLTHP